MHLARAQFASVAPVAAAHVPTVLCVDDDESILRLLEGFLRGSGFRVIGESDPGRAMRRIHSIPFDAAIVDFQMPGWNGVELAEIIHRERPDVPILMFSSEDPIPVTGAAITRFVPKYRGVRWLAEELCMALEL